MTHRGELGLSDSSKTGYSLPPDPKKPPLIDRVTYGAADDTTRDIYDNFIRVAKLKSVPNWMAMLGHNQPYLKSIMSLVMTTMTEGSISPALKEIIIFSISRWNGSRYCSACHAHAALSMNRNLTFETLLDISEGHGFEALEPRMKDALEFGMKVGLCPDKVGKADIKRLRDHGYKDAEIIEICTVAGLALMFNCITTSLAPKIDAEYARTLGLEPT